MVHNGIEYGDMQMIAECYDLMFRGLKLNHKKCAATFTNWNKGELASFLIELTGNIADKADPKKKGKFLLDAIRDAAGQKGTGKWTTMAALEVGVPIPTITAAVDARLISSLKTEREVAAKVLKLKTKKLKGVSVNDIAKALYAAKIAAYAQGLRLIVETSKARGYNTDLTSIPAIWRGGCIIRAVFLDRITTAFKKQPNLPSLLIAGDRCRALVRDHRRCARRELRRAAGHLSPGPERRTGAAQDPQLLGEPLLGRIDQLSPATRLPRAGRRNGRGRADDGRCEDRRRDVHTQPDDGRPLGHHDRGCLGPRLRSGRRRSHA
jgi:6-phosphogluconate dehydrogenase